MGTRGCLARKVTNGCPYWAMPKSGWTFIEAAPMNARYSADRGSTGSLETSRLNALSAGKTGHEPMRGPAAGLGPGFGVGFGLGAGAGSAPGAGAGAGSADGD